jgi:antitoxin component of MazEF toxin-antitoxin module
MVWYNEPKEVAMPQLTVLPHGDSAALILPAAVLKSVGLRVGDVVELTLGDRQLILRSAEDTSWPELLETITHEVFERREDAYRRLA